MGLTVQLHESVYGLQTGEREWRFAIFAQLQNLAYNSKLGGSQYNLPIVASEFPGYSYPDVIESKNSVFGNLITSPKMRGLELMKEPFVNAVGTVLNEGLGF